MNTKVWTTGEIRALARHTVEGRQVLTSARGAYLRALVETAQTELGGKADQDAQLAALKAAHRRFYPVVQEAIATDEILAAAGFAKRDIANERNRRLNFARSSYGTIKRWLRAPNHDLMKLDATKVSKSQLENASPPTRKHAMTPERVHARAGKLIGNLLGFTRQVAKIDRTHAASVINDAMNQLIKFMGENGARATTDARVAIEEQRPLRVHGKMFMPTEIRAKAM